MLLTRKSTLILVLFGAIWLGSIVHWLREHSGDGHLHVEDLHVMAEWLLSTALLACFTVWLLRHGRWLGQPPRARSRSSQSPIIAAIEKR